MSPKVRRRDVQDVAESARARARQVAAQVKPVAAQVKPVAAQVKPVAAQVKPLAARTGAAVRRGLHRTRAWTAPQLERTGQVLEDSVAPKVSAALASAARRIEPPKPHRRRRRLRKLAGITMLTGAATAAAAAVARSRAKPDVTTPAADADAGQTADADAGQTAPVTALRDEYADTSTAADVNGPVHHSS